MRFTPYVQQVLPMAILFFALVAVPFLVFQSEGLPRMRALQRELHEVKTESSDLNHDVTQLREEVRELRSDPIAVERIARNQLGLIRKSEVVFQFTKR